MGELSEPIVMNEKGSSTIDNVNVKKVENGMLQHGKTLPGNDVNNSLNQTGSRSKSHCVVTLPVGAKAGDHFIIRWPGEKSESLAIRVPPNCIGGTSVVIVAPGNGDGPVNRRRKVSHGVSGSRRGLIDRITDESNIDRSPNDVLEECAFWDTLWPNLVGLGWSKFDEKEVNKVVTYFVQPSEHKPNIQQNKGDRQKRKRDMKFVIQYVKSIGASGHKVYQHCNSAYLNCMNKNRIIYSRWGKHQSRKKKASLSEGKTEFSKKKSSRVGNNYQVAYIPAVGNVNQDSVEPLEEFEQLWDPKKAYDIDADLQIFFEDLPQDKKEMVLQSVHRNGYDLTVSKAEIQKSMSTCWTESDKKHFHESIVRCQKNFRTVSKEIGKSVNDCMKYYFSSYKQSVEYDLLKERMQAMPNAKNSKQCKICGLDGDLLCCDWCENAFHLECVDKPYVESSEYWYCSECEIKRKELGYDKNLDFCKECGVGGNLLCCDGCDNAFHLECLDPPLKDIPTEDWYCDYCKAKKTATSDKPKDKII